MRFLSLTAIVVGCSVSGGIDEPEPTRDAEGISPSVSYEIEAKHSGKLVDVAWGSTGDGANIHQWPRNGSAAQRFRFEPTSGGFYVIRAMVSGKVLDVQDRKVTEGANVQQWSYWGGDNQQWKITDAGGGYVHIRAKNSGMYLDVAWGSTNDGANIAQVKYYGSDAQRWKLVPVTPGAAPIPGGVPSTRLRITSHCAQPIWIAHSDNVSDPQNIRLVLNQSHDYNIPDAGLASTRFWPKTGCDASGHNCVIGDSGEGGGKPCPATGCMPPVDSKFEATFAPRGAKDQTWYNLSQVDGYTLPFKVVPRGEGAGSGSCVASDCAGLSLDRCPADLRIVDASGKVIACMSPCKKWNYPAPYGKGQPENVDPGLHMCCPTPPMTPEACSSAADPASVVHTEYVKVMHSMCPTAYAYAYDDAAGLHACSSQTSFEVVFCP
jgi:hypothetical protein